MQASCWSSQTGFIMIELSSKYVYNKYSSEISELKNPLIDVDGLMPKYTL